MTIERKRNRRRCTMSSQNGSTRHTAAKTSKRGTSRGHASFLLLLVFITIVMFSLILSASAFMNNKNNIVQYIDRGVKDSRIIIGKRRTHNYLAAIEGNNMSNDSSHSHSHNNNKPLGGGSDVGRRSSSKNSNIATAAVITPPARETNNNQKLSAKNNPIMKKKIQTTTTTHPNNNRKNSNRKRPQSKKQRVRTMFRQAKEMERTGQWRQACIHLKQILEIDPYDSYSHLALGRLQSRRERGGTGIGPEKKKRTSIDSHDTQKSSTTTEANTNGQNSTPMGNSLDDVDTEITPLMILQSGPSSEAREAFYDGIEKCPDSIHLWQAWALHEQSKGNTAYARTLFQNALHIDETNPYVCHGYGLLEHRCGNFDVAMELWERPLKTGQSGKSSAALVCSLAKLLVAKGKLHKARDLYMDQVTKIKSEREICEVYMAAAWLEERHFRNITRAEELLNLALDVSPGNSRALVALARLAGRKVDLEKNNSNISTSKDDVVRRRQIAIKKQLQDTCNEMVKRKTPIHKGKGKKSEVLDGRLFNAWADMEVKEGRYHRARKILIEGRKLFPADHSVSTYNCVNVFTPSFLKQADQNCLTYSKLFQAAGKVEERVGNFTGARDLYGESLMLAPSAPTLVAYALLEMRHPVQNQCNFTKVERLFEEAMLLDPRHGPIYNAYGNMELKRGNVERARQIYQNGVFAHCRDISSVYHGLAMLELAMGNFETARLVLIKGLKEVKINDGMMDNNRRKRSQFLTHTLGMLELNSNRALEAKLVFEAGLERHGNSSQLLLGAALAEVKLGNEDAARSLFERSVNVDSKHAQAWQSWGVMEMRAGNYKIAKTLFQCGLKSDPKHGALWQAYGESKKLFSSLMMNISSHDKSLNFFSMHLIISNHGKSFREL